MQTTWRQQALAAAALADPQAKAAAARAIDTGLGSSGAEGVLEPLPGVPGRPAVPVLVHPSQLESRKLGTRSGRAALLHALTHIEFNAIDLALDAAWRFAAMPEAYYRDWLHVAAEEAHHFELLRAHLKTLGHDYGDFPAHNGLWEMAERTQDDLLARLALVPRTLEARGLDAAPPIRAKLAAAGDDAAAAILDIILRDEIGHVAIGNRWFRWLCRERGVDPMSAYRTLARQHHAPVLRGPFNLNARRAAGFDESELQALQADAR
jgi:uncharacterized ferritin-like protein (DUF455 family)